jgi:4-hydroxy-tetrahydrodipicolinate reductase
MGRRIIALAGEQAHLRVVGAIVREGSPLIGASVPDSSPALRFQSAAQPLPDAQVVIDFSSPRGALEAAKLAVSRGIPLLVGTTGLPEDTLAALRESARKVGVLVAANTSVGVAVLAHAARQTARQLGKDYHVSIVEAHHIHKKDAPSGTAKRLAQAVREGGGQLPDEQILAVRGGDVVGEHTIRFAGPGEYLELTHRATSRDLFARGAIHAACWLAQQPPGWYSIDDALGLGA